MRTITNINLIRNSVLAAAALVAAGFVATIHARTADINTLTFSKEVALPGVVLPAGTYRFEVANPDSSADVVRVSSRNGRVHYMGFTLRVQRPDGLTRDRAVTFQEARRDEPVPILAWYPLGEANGHQFIYPR
jgi:hypothetical protein